MIQYEDEYNTVESQEVYDTVEKPVNTRTNGRASVKRVMFIKTNQVKMKLKQKKSLKKNPRKHPNPTQLQLQLRRQLQFRLPVQHQKWNLLLQNR